MGLHKYIFGGQKNDKEGYQIARQAETFNRPKDPANKQTQYQLLRLGYLE